MKLYRKWCAFKFRVKTRAPVNLRNSFRGKNRAEDETCSVIDDDGSGGCGAGCRVGCIRGGFAGIVSTRWYTEGGFEKNEITDWVAANWPRSNQSLVARMRLGVYYVYHSVALYSRNRPDASHSKSNISLYGRPCERISKHEEDKAREMSGSIDQIEIS